jgi:DNA-directed RNA polymerase II subunit RPB2
MTYRDIPLFKMPIMLHSSYCVLHNKPRIFLKEAGECPYDHGGYFIIEGAEKVLVTKQEQAFNTFYITPKVKDPKDPQSKLFATISCLNPVSRRVKRVTFRQHRDDKILVGLPFVRDPVPLFIVFRALGFQSDEEIIKLIYPNFDSDEAKLFMPKLQPSIVNAWPFLNTFTAIQYIKFLT